LDELTPEHILTSMPERVVLEPVRTDLEPGGRQLSQLTSARKGPSLDSAPLRRPAARPAKVAGNAEDACRKLPLQQEWNRLVDDTCKAVVERDANRARG